MQIFVNFIKENYSYFVFAIEFIFVIVGVVVAFIQRFRFKKVRSNNEYLSDQLHCFYLDNRFLSLLPEWIDQANVLYPIHGDGLKRFDYVYQKALDLFNEEPSEVNRKYVFDCIDEVLHADKFVKISRDTQDHEPKKEFSYEKKEDEPIKGSQDLRQDGEENQSAERSACYVSRRN